ncbi:MAG TPA: hypothetical protein VF017_07055 [Thermoanaerobaculia bacterium]|nr:hypothetical protein [Thermoanaerobaculia bacterium]
MKWIVVRSRTKRTCAGGLLVVALAATWVGSPIGASPPEVACNVPGSHATVQAAVDNPSCTEVVLGSRRYRESVLVNRTVVLSGPVSGAALLSGSLSATGAGTVVTVSHLAVASSCEGPAVQAMAGARIVGTGVVVLRPDSLPCPGPLFADGFESGDLSAWTTVVPNPP